MPIFCRACSKAGHLTDDCPDEQLPACVPLPPPSAKHREILGDLLIEIKGKNQMIAKLDRAYSESVQLMIQIIA